MNNFIEFSPIIKDKEFIKQLLSDVEDKCLNGHHDEITGIHYANEQWCEIEGWHITFSASLDENNHIEFSEINFSPVFIEPFNQLYSNK